MRIAIGGISHETSTFARKPTTLCDFETGFGLYRGHDMITRFRGANICSGGFIEGADKHGFEVVPLLWAFAYPSGLIVREDYEALKQELLDRLWADEAARGPVDGVLLDLHGAMVVEGIDDGDGDVIAGVREVIGPDRPLMVTFENSDCQQRWEISRRFAAPERTSSAVNARPIAGAISATSRTDGEMCWIESVFGSPTPVSTWEP
jgi:microcystin degradation protein MlrC